MHPKASHSRGLPRYIMTRYGLTAYAPGVIMIPMPKSVFVPFTVALVFLVLCFLCPHPARADIEVGGDVDYALPTNEDLSSGGGFAVRLGNRFDGHFSSVTPELSLSYHSFSGFSAPRGAGGVRLAIGSLVMGGLYAHAGLARLTGNELDRADLAFALDVGGFLDLAALDSFHVGAHAAYNRLSDTELDDSLVFATFGLHAEVFF